MVESHTPRGIVGPINPVTIKQTGTGFRQVTVPDLVCLLGERDTKELVPPSGIEYAQLHLFSVLGKK